MGLCIAEEEILSAEETPSMEGIQPIEKTLPRQCLFLLRQKIY